MTLTRPISRHVTHLILPMLFAFGFGLLAYFDGLARWNQFLYDIALTVWHRPTWDQVVIVAIDEPSLEALGRWPWPRRTHAALVERLTDAGARVIGLDLVIAEPDVQDPAGDQILAQAIRQHGRVVLPVLNEQLRAGGLLTETLPLPQLAEAAGALGHVDVEPDADGVVRGVYLRAGLGSPHWPTFALAMLQLGESHQWSQLPGMRRPQTESPPFAWVRDNYVLLPYGGGAGHFTRVSYVDVLTGKIPDARLRDHYVLVGATVAGLNDIIYTPLKGQHTAVPGVEFNAHVLDSLSHRLFIQSAPPSWQALLTVLCAIIPFVFYIRSAPRWAPLITLGLTFTTLFVSAALLYSMGLWVGAAPALLAIVLSYPLWNWLQLNHAIDFLRGELQRRHGHAITTVPIANNSPREIADIWHMVTLLEHDAHHDPLTNLPNRILLWDRLDHAIANAKRRDHLLAVLFVDLDQFKIVNDGLGHDVGDALLQEIANRLLTIKRAQDTVARLSGDEFVILLESMKDTDTTAYVARKVLQTLSQPVTNLGHELTVSASIGISFYPRDGSDASTLVKNADTAMYRAKRQGGNTFQFYDQEMNARARDRLALEQDLRHAVAAQELEIVYQPQVELKQNRITGFEALLRWHHPVRGIISPEKFIPLAEETGLIVNIGQWIIHQAAQQIATWQNSLGVNIPIAVNLSPRQFQQGNIVQQVQQVLNDTRIPGKLLGFEITEGTIMKNVDSAVDTMNALKALGVELAIDDFGTGYSSLNYIKNFPVDHIKIDRTFIQDITTNQGNAAVARTIIAMAHSLKRLVVAEGVETSQQNHFLCRRRCDRAQGFYFSHPLTASAATNLLRDRSNRCLALEI